VATGTLIGERLVVGGSLAGLDAWASAAARACLSVADRVPQIDWPRRF
jgi:hypothetical protein